MASDAMTRAGGTGAPARSRGMADAGLSIVVPLFNEAANLSALHARIVEVAGALKATRGLTTEVVYVDDGSRDGTLAAARELPAENLDVHAGQIQGFFDIPTDNLYASPVMVRDIRERFKLDNVMVVSPDVGGVVRARGLAKRINAPLAIIDKRRERAGEFEGYP